MNKRLLFFVIFIHGLRAGPQVRWGGCLRLDTFADTRQTVATEDGAWMIWPKKVECDSQGGDINARGRLGMSPAYSSAYVEVTDKINETKLRGKIEMEFASEYPVGLMDLRDAFFKAEWEKRSLLVGHALHPLVEACSPNTVSWGGGNPAAPFAFFPQICWKNYVGAFTFILAPYSEYDYLSEGFVGYSSTYMHNSMSPGLYLGVQVENKWAKFGVSFDMKRLLPALSTTTTSTTSMITKTIIHDECLMSFIGAVYGELQLNNFKIKAESIFGQNGYDMCLLGGYALGGANFDNGKRCYTNINFASGWIDIENIRHEKLQPGIFIGYAKNLGTRRSVFLDDECRPRFYGEDDQLSQVLRVAPRLRSQFNNLEIGVEMDFSVAWYGRMNCKGVQPCTYYVSNLRPLLVTCYYF